MTASDCRRDRLMHITRVADRLGVSVYFVRRLVAERRIPDIKFGHLLRFDPKTIDDWLDKGRGDEAWPSRRRPLRLVANRRRGRHITSHHHKDTRAQAAGSESQRRRSLWRGSCEGSARLLSHQVASSLSV